MPFSSRLKQIWYRSSSVPWTTHLSFKLDPRATPAASATGASMDSARRVTADTSTGKVSAAGRLSSRVRASRCSVIRVSRSASVPMSETKSRRVTWSMVSFWRMESASSRMEARGVFSSWEASDTKRRRTSSVVWRRSVSWLNSSASRASSSRPEGWSRCPYSPSPTMRMALSRAVKREESIWAKNRLITRVTAATTREMLRKFFCKFNNSAPWTASSSQI